MKRALFASLALSFVWACHGGPPKPEGAAVVIKDSHYHTRYCGHYRFGTQWYFIQMHRHGVDCGHELENGDWILPED